MFERFTKDARAAVVDAQEVARGTGSRTVDTRHLVVAVLQRPGPPSDAVAGLGVDVARVTERARAELAAGGLDGDALAGIGIDLDAVRRQADSVFGAGALERAARPPAGHLPFARDAKKSLELALREAIRLKHRAIQRAHLLLGVLRAECPGRTLLLEAGVDVAALRAALEEQAAAA